MQQDRRRAHPWRGVLAFAGLTGLVYAGLYGTWRALPYIRPGADLVLEAKRISWGRRVRLASSTRSAPGRM